jgi:hypothetical protein
MLGAFCGIMLFTSFQNGLIVADPDSYCCA